MRKKRIEENEDCFMSLTNDYAFVQCMKNLLVLRGFLAAVLRIPVEEIENIRVNDRYLKKAGMDGKLGILDVRVYIRTAGDIDIEMQVERFKYWEKRTMFYASQMYVEDVEKGEDYGQCKKVIMIQVLGFNQCRETNYFHSVFDIRERRKHFPYGDELEIHVIELGKLDTSVNPEDKPLQKWAQLINAGSREERKMMEKDPYLEEALKELEKMENDPEKRREYQARDRAIRDYYSLMHQNKEEGWKVGREVGREEGREEGRDEEAKCLESLLEILESEGKPEMMLKALKDPELKTQLFKKYNIH